MKNPPRASFLYDFRVLKPRFKTSQESSLEWLAAAHAQADRIQSLPDTLEKYRKILSRVGCSSKQIHQRGHELSDFNHLDWNEMRIFRLNESPHGLGAEARTQAFSEFAQAAMDRFYDDSTSAPDDLIHVTCTGYLSPSPAQRLVSEKGWGRVTQVMHAYHMGCYAAFPAIKQARGLLAMAHEKKRVDVVHTELCSLHLNPADHSLQNFVIQTLFADGYARYSLSPELPTLGTTGLEVLAMREILVPETSDAMTWFCGDHGMVMTLSKDVPAIISQGLRELIDSLLTPIGLDTPSVISEARFAIHPGGPKILDQVAATLGLRPEQVQTSRTILEEYGNMSSATLPHIWERIVSDPAVPSGSLILSLAFGPGLTLCGSLFRKVS